MKLEAVMGGVLATGVLMALLWIAIWEIFIPDTLPGLAWSEYGSFTTHIVLVGWVVASVSVLLSWIGKR